MLFETLRQAPGAFTIGGESHRVIEGIPGFSVRDKGWTSNRLTADDARPELVEALAASFYAQLRDRDGLAAQGAVRMLEKTPKNALRVPFFNAAWPDAQFIFLYRDARQTLASMMEAWQSGYFRTYPRLPGWQGPPWSLLLIPGWRELNGQPLPHIVATQWRVTMETLLDDLEALGDARVHAIDYDEFVAAPAPAAQEAASFAGLGWDQQLGTNLPLSQTTVSAPGKDKWRRMADVIESVWPMVEAADRRARDFVSGLRGRGSPKI